MTNNNKSLVIFYRNVNNDHLDSIEVKLPSNSGEILKIQRLLNGKLHTTYGRVNT